MQSCDTVRGVIALRESGMSFRACCEHHGVGSSTIQLIMKRYRESGLTLDELMALSEEDTLEIIYPSKLRRNTDLVMPDFESMCRRMEEKGSRLNMAVLWWEYRNANPEHACQYTQFVKYFREYVERTRGPQHLKMLVERVPGERMYVDWVGDQPLLLYIPEQDVLRKVHVFCATIGVSSMGYAEIFPDEKTPSFVTGVIHAMEYFGGVPRFIVPDNLKAAVTQNTKDNLILTSACLDLQEHYDVTFLPPPPLKPKGKGAVESYVRYIESHYIEALKAAAAQKPFVSVDAMNEVGLKQVDEFNNRLERGRSSTRQNIFQDIDLPHMRPLPDEPFTMWDYIRYERVPTTYHITYDGHQYSVPYLYVGKPAVVKASMSRILITDESNNIIAQHSRSYDPDRKKTTDVSHMPQTHRYYLEINEMDGMTYREWASGVGPHTAQLIEALLQTTSREEQMYEKCAAVIVDIKEKPASVIESAAAFCLAAGIISCSGFKEAVMGSRREPQSPSGTSAEALQSNVRGKEYYA